MMEDDNRLGGDSDRITRNVLMLDKCHKIKLRVVAYK